MPTTFIGEYLTAPADFEPVLTEKALIDLAADPGTNTRNILTFDQLEEAEPASYARIVGVIEETIKDVEGTLHRYTQGIYLTPLVPFDTTVLPVLRRLARITLLERKGILKGDVADQRRDALIRSELAPIASGSVTLTSTRLDDVGAGGTGNDLIVGTPDRGDYPVYSRRQSRFPGERKFYR